MLDTQLSKALKDALVDALLRMPSASTFLGRSTALLDGIPNHVTLGLNRSEANAFDDLTGVVKGLDDLGRLDDGVRLVVMLIDNACRRVKGTELGRHLEKLRADIEREYGFEPPLDDLPEPEVLIFGGEGEWVAHDFMEQARSAARQVARLSIPRYIDGNRVQGVGVGTGWLVGPRLMLTNHHVIVAREKKKEAAPTAADFKLQGENTIAWFDYHVEGKHKGPVVKATELVASDAKLDFALLRLANRVERPKRHPMALADEAPLQRGARLNIVQCPGGGPLRFAIRNNFCVGFGDHKVRYLTDTKTGSSGAPVLDDNWRVVAMHRGANPVKPEAHPNEAGKSEVAKFHNEGIVIHEILRRLPADARAEIEAAQVRA
jgi:hypothetical protein